MSLFLSSLSLSKTASSSGSKCQIHLAAGKVIHQTDFAAFIHAFKKHLLRIYSALNSGLGLWRKNGEEKKASMVYDTKLNEE